MSDSPPDENPYRGYHAQLLDACVGYRAKVDKLEAENAALREQLINVTSELTVTKANALADKERLEADNAALRAELKRQRALWQATYALGLAERDFAIKCIETALGPNKAQSWGDDQIMRQCLNEGGTPT